MSITKASKAMFAAMAREGWMTATDGDENAPTGLFGYVVNTPEELPELLTAFEDTIAEHGKPKDGELLGAWLVHVHGNGNVWAVRLPAARVVSVYQGLKADYARYLAGEYDLYQESAPANPIREESTMMVPA
ncbi:hypothetical protein SEA_OCTOBIEN14_140 [Gordonia phage Octobien14]|uniref:Uncharacterized protein n=1 Tax=Gordonia phage Octobien14 TaxID=2483673 RepID=A0A3G3MA29_9CAUD|nr:hypothetical protein L3Y22_gp104 [Gordonia phage Octobien14]AYR03275.1 hypothetical protein SEA_OCTOBIEN14_140 [Gordonia phage Octobien14]